MNFNFTSNRGFPAGKPIANALVMVVGALAIAASVVLGFFAFLVVLSLVAICAAILGLRAWWFRHAPGRTTARTDAPPREAESRGGARGNVIEGEFRVIEGRKGGGRRQ